MGLIIYHREGIEMIDLGLPKLAQILVACEQTLDDVEAFSKTIFMSLFLLSANILKCVC